MSRKSKRGFKRLENHEMSEFSALNGGGVGDSEEDLLDLTGDEEHDVQDRWCNCCCWGTCLYLVLLTFIVAILGVFCGYLMYNVWQINSDTSAAHRDLQASIDAVTAHLDELRKETGNRFIVVNLKLSNVNETVVALQSRAELLSTDLDQLDKRIKALESQPQEKLIQEVDNIHHEMAILNQNMGLLNRSLDDVQEIRARIASVGGVMDSYSAQFVSYSQQIGDVVKSNTDIRNEVVAVDEKLKKFGDEVAEVKNSVNKSHDRMKQSDDLLSAQLTQLQSLVSGLNDSLNDEVGQVWTNISKVEAKLDRVDQKLSTIDEKINTKQPLPSSTAPPPLRPRPPADPTSPPVVTTTESKESVLTTPTVDVTTQGEERETTTKEPDDSSTTSSTSLPTGEPTTPHTESLESSHSVGPEDELTQASNDTVNGTTEDEGGVDAEEGITTTADGSSTTVSAQDELPERNKNEKAMAALKIYIDDFDIMDRNFDGKLTPSEMGNVTPQIFMLLDANGDGYVTLSELQHMMTILQSKHDMLEDNSANADSSFN